jgi:nucleoside 2-deoxyribosyltransferase
MLKPNIYLIGPTTFCTKLNIESFETIQDAFEQHGFRVTKPHDLFTEDMQREISLDEQLAVRSNAVKSCDFVIVLPGHTDDSFATAELAFARFIKKPVHRLLEGIDRIIARRNVA